jgi:predicted nucleic acid-binding protein
MGTAMTGCDFVLDTNAVIYLQKGLLGAPLPAGRIAVSVITEIELRGFAGLAAAEEAALDRFFASIAVIGLSDAVKDETIRLRRLHQVKLPDAIIAATALTQGAVLLTNDDRLHRLAGLTARRLALRA